jgi:hypothetical protein
MKTSIIYAKENDRKRKKGRRRDIEREGEITLPPSSPVYTKLSREIMS